MRLAPDQRIYISTYVGTNILHYIENPDSLGLSCNVIQNSFLTPSYNTFSFPNLPNWDLSSLDGSVCDTLALSLQLAKKNYEIKIAPNPAENYYFVTYEIPNYWNAEFTLYDSEGILVEHKTLYGHSKYLLFHSEALHEGIYFYSVILQGEKVSNGKLSIVK